MFETLKSPVTAGVATVTELPPATRFVTANSSVALALLIGTGPKSCATGVSSSPVSGRPLPVSERTYGLPAAAELIVSVPVSSPVAGGVNCTPTQQLGQVPDALVVKAELGGCPWPYPMSSTITAV